tara:strand:- start:1008 stop:1259 length:252 start_codon:yes stop_codon:yes gene_type:complete
MSFESDVGKSVSELVSFIKEKVSSNLVESRNQGSLEIDDITFERVLNLVDLSTSQGLSLGYVNVESALNAGIKDLKKTSKKKK